VHSSVTGVNRWDEFCTAHNATATVATRREKNDVPLNEKRIDFTPTGLLMEGNFTSLRSLVAFLAVNECYGDLSTTSWVARRRFGVVTRFVLHLKDRWGPNS
jgi:hypothetical protein